MSESDLLKNAIEREVARGWTVEFQSETSARLSNGTQQLILEFDGDAVRYDRTSTGANVPPPEQRPPPSPPQQRPPPIPVQVIPPARYIFRKRRGIHESPEEAKTDLDT